MVPLARTPRSRSLRPRWPRVVLFDLDDTLFDHSHALRSGLVRVRRLEPRFRTRTIEEMRAEYSRHLESIHPQVVAGAISGEEARTERFRLLARACGFAVERAEAERFAQEYRAQYLRAEREVPGARALLDRLRGRATVGIVTNNRADEQHEKLRKLGIDRHVDVLVISGAVGVSKPDPRIFRIALKEAGAGPEEAVMVGDSWESDIVGARAAGIRAIWFNRFQRTAPTREPVATIDSYVPVGRVMRLLRGTGEPGPRRSGDHR